MHTELLLRGNFRAVTNISQSLPAHPPHYILVTNIGVSLGHGLIHHFVHAIVDCAGSCH
jgi:hypothetical protein